jgi:hypothetical protein
VDILKIDKSFVWVASAPTRDSVLAAIIGLAQASGLSTVAEGIDSRDHAELLRRLGCTSGQGYLFARPGPFDDLDLTHVSDETAAVAALFVHQLVLIGLVLASRRAPWPPEVKYGAVPMAGVAISFTVGSLLARLPGSRASSEKPAERRRQAPPLCRCVGRRC